MKNEAIFRGVTVVLLVLCALVATACISACGSGDSGSGSEGGSNGSGDSGRDDSSSLPLIMEGPPPLYFSPVPGGSDSQLVSAATGGTLTAEAATLEIPAGALSSDTTLSMILFRDTSRGNYTYLAMFEPSGLLLNTPGTLVIALDPPLPLGMNLNLLLVDSSDPDEFYDTGDYAEVTADGTEVRIPIEHFSAAGCAKLNCHGHSLRNMIEALLAREETDTKDKILSKIRDVIDNEYVLPSEDPDDIGLDAHGIISRHYDILFQTGECIVEPQELLAYLNTFYNLATLRLNAGYNGRIVMNENDLDRTAPDCIDELKALTTSSDLPPILLFGKKFTVNGSPDSVDKLGSGPVIYDGRVPHSAPLILRGEDVVFENGLSIHTGTLAEELEEARQNHPDAKNEIPRVAAVDLDKLDHFRLLKSKGALLEEFQKWDPQKIFPLYDATPWAAVRVWVPKGQDPGLCDLDFPVTYSGTGTYTITNSLDFGLRGSETCESDQEWTITLYDDGTLSVQQEITRTAGVRTDGHAFCVDYDEPVILTRFGTHANWEFEYTESTLAPYNVIGVYSPGSIRSEPDWYSNNDFAYSEGIWNQTVRFSINLTKQ